MGWMLHRKKRSRGEEHGSNKNTTVRNSFMSDYGLKYKPEPEEKEEKASWLKRAWRKVVKPVATLALGFAISVSFAQTANADEYLWKMRAEAWVPEDTAWTFRRIIYFQVIDGDTLPCTEEPASGTMESDSVDTNWVFQTITDTAGNVYYINRRDSIDSEGAVWDWAIVRFVGEKGTKSELRERYIDIANRLEFHGDTTSTLWIHVDEMYYWLHPPPVERNIYFYAFNDTDYYEAVRVEYRGNSEEYWTAYIGGPVYSLPFEAVELSVEERSRLPEGSKLYVYPSPANSVVNMILGKESAYGNVRIYDETGRLVGDIHVSGGYGRGVRIDVSGLNSGVYNVVFDGVDVHGNKITATGRFTVVK